MLWPQGGGGGGGGECRLGGISPLSHPPVSITGVGGGGGGGGGGVLASTCLPSPQKQMFGNKRVPKIERLPLHGGPD